jgi:hypothetical protein
MQLLRRLQVAVVGVLEWKQFDKDVGYLTMAALVLPYRLSVMQVQKLELISQRREVEKKSGLYCKSLAAE